MQLAVGIAKSEVVQDSPVLFEHVSQVDSNYFSQSHCFLTNGMDSLLDDSGGVHLFYMFLSSRYSCGHFLDFWFACKGFRLNLDPGNPERLFQVAKVIYRTYIKSGATYAVPLPLTLKHEVANRMSSYYDGYSSHSTQEKVDFDRNIFESVQDTVKHILEDTYYPKFLEYVKGLVAPCPAISNTSARAIVGVVSESCKTENEFIHSSVASHESPRMKVTKRKYRRSAENSLPHHQKVSPPGVSSHNSPLFSPVPELRQNVLTANDGDGSSNDSCCIRTATPNPDVSAPGDELNCCCCWCCGCFEDCPQPEGKEEAPIGDSLQAATSQSSSDPGIVSTAATSGGLKPNSLPASSEEMYALTKLGHQKSQASDSTDKSAPMQPANHQENAKCTTKACQQTVNNLDRPESVIPTEPNQGNVVVRPNLAQTNPALFVLLLTKRLEKVKEVHDKMEKLRSWVSQVDEKSHISSSLIDQGSVLYPDHTNHLADVHNQLQSVPAPDIQSTSCDQISMSIDTVHLNEPPWSMNTIKPFENKATCVTDSSCGLPAASEDDAQGILDDHCSRIWADEKDVLKSHRRTSQSTSRRSRAVVSSVHDVVRNKISDRYRVNVPTSCSQQHQRTNDIAPSTTLRRNSSTVRTTSTNRGCSLTPGTVVGRFCTSYARASALPASNRSDARSTTSWDSGVVPESAYSSHSHYRKPQQQKRLSRSYHSTQQPWAGCPYQQTSAVDQLIDDDTTLDSVFSQVDGQHRKHGDLDAASLQALSSSTTELAIVNSEVTAKLIQHMTRQYNRSSGTQRAHSSHDQVILPVHNASVSSHLRSPDPICIAQHKRHPAPCKEVSTSHPPIASSCLHCTVTSTTHTSSPPDCRTELNQLKLLDSRHPYIATPVPSNHHFRSIRTRIFPTPSDTSSTFDSGISSTYDQLSLGDQDNRSRRFRQWPTGGRNFSTASGPNYSRTPSAPRRPSQTYSSASNYQWQQVPTAIPSLVGSQHHHTAYSSHQTPYPSNNSYGNNTASVSTGAVSSCAYCHPAPCHHHHVYHRPHVYHHHHHTTFCQAASDGGTYENQDNYAGKNTCSSTPTGGKLLQHWLAYQQQQSNAQSPLDDGDLRKARQPTTRGIVSPPTSSAVGSSTSGRKPNAVGQHRRSLTTGHRHRQKISGIVAPAGEEFISETVADELTGTITTAPGTSTSSDSGVIVGYYLCDDPVPYRTVWTGTSSLGVPSSDGKSAVHGAGMTVPNSAVNPDSNSTADGTCQISPSLTLGQFKQLIAKKGSYRYFFKKPSNEFGTGVVHEELTEDDTLLPLWDGKVVARVERVD